MANVFISYLDDNNQTISTYVELIEKAASYITFKTKSGNVITISYNRLLKLKESQE